ncbi:hypothetical protein [Bradyrhizobium sp. LVM 105]|uniref:hypothetical protein n=1 Tax=Bradyrhizobium sp. LVM 105 TaxID=2341115 RepID=UPI0013E062E9|nr:hypothetical protein [Bradyrhizobium sp. LVM 105]
MAMYVRLIVVTPICRMMIRVQRASAFSRDQKLFPHFSKTGATIFSIEQLEYGGHDHPHRLA